MSSNAEDSVFLAATLFVIILVMVLIFRVTFVDLVEKHEIAYRVDHVSGEFQKLEQSGYFVSLPLLTTIYTIDSRPQQVCQKADHLFVSCITVRFVPEGLEEFIKIHGVRPPVNVPQVLAAHAAEGKEYPFLEVTGMLGKIK